MNGTSKGRGERDKFSTVGEEVSLLSVVSRGLFYETYDCRKVDND